MNVIGVSNFNNATGEVKLGRSGRPVPRDTDGSAFDFEILDLLEVDHYLFLESLTLRVPASMHQPGTSGYRGPVPPLPPTVRVKPPLACGPTGPPRGYTAPAW